MAQFYAPADDLERCQDSVMTGATVLQRPSCPERTRLSDVLSRWSLSTSFCAQAHTRSRMSGVPMR
jgi:hypothetical protein